MCVQKAITSQEVKRTSGCGVVGSLLWKTSREYDEMVERIERKEISTNFRCETCVGMKESF